MSLYLDVADCATESKKHPVTIRKALELGTLHGFQNARGGRWSVKPACLEAFVEGRLCEHQQQNVTPIRKAASA